MANLKFLVFDIETGPNLGYIWGKYEQNVLAYEKEWELLSFAYKWVGTSKTIAVGQNKFTEEQLVLRLWHLFDEADVVIAHNGNKFDIRKINAKFLEYGLTPPSPYKSIDTLLVARRYFALNSNKLDDLGTLLRVGNKIKHSGFELWLRCLRGEAKAWAEMLRYNKQDVVLLEKVYLRLLPWITNHPNRGDLYQTNGVCPKCGSAKLTRRGFTKARIPKQRYQCECGGWCNESSVKKPGRLVNAT